MQGDRIRKQKKCSEDQLNFVTRGQVTEATQRAFTDIYWRKSTYIRVLYALLIILSLGCIWFVFHGEWFSLILFIVLIAALLWAFNISRKRAVRVYTQRHQYTDEENAAEYMTGYAEDFVYTENHRTGTCDRVPYSDIRYVYETDQYLFLLTDEATFMETFKEGLSEEEEKELLAFLKQKGVKKK